MSPRPLEHEHTKVAIAARLAAGTRPNYLRDFVYGGIDGAVTTFAIIAGTIGANLSPRIVLILGAANIVADGFSMAAGNYLATRAEADDYDRIRRIEARHIAIDPAGEREEVKQIYAAKGFRGDDLDRLVDVICADEERWIETMVTEEYGLPREIRSPWRAASSTFAAFLLCGLIPLVPFIFGLGRSFETATGLTAVVFFTVGSVKARWSTVAWWRSGFVTLAVGAAAALLAFAVGNLFRLFSDSAGSI